MIQRLEESGWKEQVKMACKDVVKERGLDRVTVEDLVQVEKLFPSHTYMYDSRRLVPRVVRWCRMISEKSCSKILKSFWRTKLKINNPLKESEE